MFGNQRVRQLLGAQNGWVNSHHQNFLVVRTVEDPNHAVLWNTSVRPPQIIVIEFLGAWSLEGVDVASLWIYAGHDVLDHAVFAGGIHPLNDEQHRPAILRVELLLQIAQQAGAVINNFLALLLAPYFAGVTRVVILQTELFSL